MGGTLGRVTSDRDVGAFQQRAAVYETGWLGRLHHDIADRVTSLAEAYVQEPLRILDVGCGTGYLLRRLADTFPAATTVSGIDPAPAMIQVAEATATDPRLTFTLGVAEQLPYEAASFDLVISTTSFDHWRDQQGGLAECARVLKPGGQLLLCDQFSAWLLPTLIGSRRHKARTKRRATALLISAGFTNPHWHGLYTVLIRAVTAIKPAS